MVSEKMGRRKFIKNVSSAFLGVMGSHFLSGLPVVHAEKKPNLEYRTLGKTGLKVTSVRVWGQACDIAI